MNGLYSETGRMDGRPAGREAIDRRLEAREAQQMESEAELGKSFGKQESSPQRRTLERATKVRRRARPHQRQPLSLQRTR